MQLSLLTTHFHFIERFPDKQSEDHMKGKFYDSFAEEYELEELDHRLEPQNNVDEKLISYESVNTFENEDFDDTADYRKVDYIYETNNSGQDYINMGVHRHKNDYEYLQPAEDAEGANTEDEEIEDEVEQDTVKLVEDDIEVLDDDHGAFRYQYVKKNGFGDDEKVYIRNEILLNGFERINKSDISYQTKNYNNFNNNGANEYIDDNGGEDDNYDNDVEYGNLKFNIDVVAVENQDDVGIRSSSHDGNIFNEQNNIIKNNESYREDKQKYDKKAGNNIHAVQQPILALPDYILSNQSSRESEEYLPQQNGEAEELQNKVLPEQTHRQNEIINIRPHNVSANTNRTSQEFRQAILQSACDKHRPAIAPDPLERIQKMIAWLQVIEMSQDKTLMSHLIVDDNHKTLFCFVPKVCEFLQL